VRTKVKILEKEIIAIKLSFTFTTIIKIDDWDHYFKSIKGKLQLELDELRLEFDV
jgi:hypothetical protein